MVRSKNHLGVITSILEHIEDELARAYWNKYQTDIDSPFRNTESSYRNDTFNVNAYQWDDNEQPNFQYKGFKVWWYKHLGRGMVFECDRIIDLEYLDKMLFDCEESIKMDFRS